MAQAERARALSEQVIGLSSADQVEVSISGGTTTHLRWARNSPSTSGSWSNTQLELSCTFGSRTGSVSLNPLDDDSLRDAVARCEEIARLAPEDPEAFPMYPRMRSITSLRTVAEKYLWYGDGMQALLDLRADPLEQAALLPLHEDARTRAALFRLRLEQQLNDHRTRYETAIGQMRRFRAAARDGAHGLADLEQMGYIGEGGGGAPSAMTPFLGFPSPPTD